MAEIREISPVTFKEPNGNQESVEGIVEEKKTPGLKKLESKIDLVGGKINIRIYQLVDGNLPYCSKMQMNTETEKIEDLYDRIAAKYGSGTFQLTIEESGKEWQVEISNPDFPNRFTKKTETPVRQERPERPVHIVNEIPGQPVGQSEEVQVYANALTKLTDQLITMVTNKASGEEIEKLKIEIAQLKNAIQSNLPNRQSSRPDEEEEPEQENPMMNRLLGEIGRIASRIDDIEDSIIQDKSERERTEEKNRIELEKKALEDSIEQLRTEISTLKTAKPEKQTNASEDVLNIITTISGVLQKNTPTPTPVQPQRGITIEGVMAFLPTVMPIINKALNPMGQLKDFAEIVQAFGGGSGGGEGGAITGKTVGLQLLSKLGDKVIDVVSPENIRAITDAIPLLMQQNPQQTQTQLPGPSSNATQTVKPKQGATPQPQTTSINEASMIVIANAINEASNSLKAGKTEDAARIIYNGIPLANVEELVKNFKILETVWSQVDAEAAKNKKGMKEVYDMLKEQFTEEGSEEAETVEKEKDEPIEETIEPKSETNSKSKAKKPKSGEKPTEKEKKVEPEIENVSEPASEPKVKEKGKGKKGKKK